jgi:hypothetical protein
MQQMQMAQEQHNQGIANGAAGMIGQIPQI